MSELREELDEIREAIGSIVERLDDLAFRELRQAVARGEQKRPEIERRLTRARNGLLRALPLLSGGDEPDDE